ncbi:Aspartyl protease [hydrothermal vent metagenome]|uniref:Aspartyl protease n=1 Tax=hydrothermal vent metagenome TaxID=652676 RepID=A0A3B0RV88_9ZZZZ
MENIDNARLTYLTILGVAIAGSYLVSNRKNLGKTLQQAMIWGLIFLGVIAGIGLWDDIRQTAQPSFATVTGDNQIKLRRAADGHYYVNTEVNGKTVRFMVDTGASDIVLTPEDARRAGFDPDTLDYPGTAYTANGAVRTAPIRLDSLSIGPITDTGLRAVVNGGEMEQSLLGMSYLQRFSSIEFSGGFLVLTR